MPEPTAAELKEALATLHKFFHTLPGRPTAWDLNYLDIEGFEATCITTNQHSVRVKGYEYWNLAHALVQHADRTKGDVHAP